MDVARRAVCMYLGPHANALCYFVSYDEQKTALLNAQRYQLLKGTPRELWHDLEDDASRRRMECDRVSEFSARLSVEEATAFQPLPKITLPGVTFELDIMWEFYECEKGLMNNAVANVVHDMCKALWYQLEDGREVREEVCRKMLIVEKRLAQTK